MAAHLRPERDQPDLESGKPEAFIDASGHTATSDQPLIKAALLTSLGATDAPAQASVLTLYDPDRTRAFKHHEQMSSRSAFQNAFRQALNARRDVRGAGLRILTGNGNYAFIDTETEARKVLVEQMTGTLVTIAKDVKIQVEFNPQQVAAYRLIGCENRILAAQDFNDDRKDAGEIGAGHTVTASYEIVPADAASSVTVPPVDDLRYQNKGQPSEAAQTGERLTLKLRYKQPDGDTSRKVEFPLKDNGKRFGQASQDFRFAAAVAAFGMLLRDSQFKGDATYAAVQEMATEAASGDTSGYREEFLRMVAKAKELAGK